MPTQILVFVVVGGVLPPKNNLGQIEMVTRKQIYQKMGVVIEVGINFISLTEQMYDEQDYSIVVCDQPSDEKNFPPPIVQPRVEILMVVWPNEIQIGNESKEKKLKTQLDQPKLESKDEKTTKINTPKLSNMTIEI